MATGITRPLRWTGGRLGHWRRRWRSRRELARVEPRLLRDAGIHALDAWSEVRKPFWRR